MSAAEIAEVRDKINALDQNISACENDLRSQGKSDLQISEHTGVQRLREQVTALINRRERLEQQQQASAGKFLFVYFYRGHLYRNRFRLNCIKNNSLIHCP